MSFREGGCGRVQNEDVVELKCYQCKFRVDELEFEFQLELECNGGGAVGVMAAIFVVRIGRYGRKVQESLTRNLSDVSAFQYYSIKANIRVTTRSMSLSPTNLFLHSSAAMNRISQPSSQSNKLENTSAIPADSLMTKIIKGLGMLGGFYSKRSILTRSATTLYSACVEQSLHPAFMRTCQLPDTFQSWFLITHLHVWMCLVRLKQEGSDGKRMYKTLVELFWKDVEFRMRNMGVDDSRVIQESTRELFSMFYGLLFAYDEGLTSSDVVLAEAVWRNLFHDAKDDFNMQNVGFMVKYIRKEIQRLDNINRDVLLQHGSFKFGSLPLDTQG
eukprot:gene2963-5764_t